MTEAPAEPSPHMSLKVRVMYGHDIALGPGKADLLDAIQEYGSISAAARHLGMSYRRAWLLVDTMNRCFVSELVETRAGARHGATLSALGADMLSAYRQAVAMAQHRLDSASRPILAALKSEHRHDEEPDRS